MRSKTSPLLTRLARGCRRNRNAAIAQRAPAQQHRRSPFKSADDFVFTAATGRGRDYRHVGDAFRLAVKRAGLRWKGRLSLHTLGTGTRACSLPSASKVVFVSRQLGHANANVTLSVYGHLFAQREHGEVARRALEASYTAMREVGRP